MARKFALLIGSYRFQDTLLQTLVAPASDIKLLSTVLADPKVGNFQTSVLINTPSHKTNQAIERFFSGREREDTLLLYFSGHGIKDERGGLHFAALDTRHDLLHTTSIPASLVNESMLHSRAKRQLLFLDCCYGGAFPKGLVAKSTLRKMGIDEQFQPGPLDQFRGGGRVILTSSDAMQYSFEGAGISGKGISSVFTRHLIAGLASGEADSDGDGLVGVDELFEYVQERVVADNPSQTPVKWSFEVKDEIVVATSRRGEQPASLPGAIENAVQSPLAQVRIGAVRELRFFLQGRDKRLADAARRTLKVLCEDDSRSVALEAQKVLSEAVVSPVKEESAQQNVFTEPIGIASPIQIESKSDEIHSQHRWKVWSAVSRWRSTSKSRTVARAFRASDWYGDWRTRHLRLAVAVEMGLLWAVVSRIQERANGALGVFIYHHLFTKQWALTLISASISGFVFGAFVAATLVRSHFKIGRRAFVAISLGWAAGFALQMQLFIPIMGPSGFLDGVQEWLSNLGDGVERALHAIAFNVEGSIVIFNLFETVVGVAVLVCAVWKRSVGLKLFAVSLFCFWFALSFASLPERIVNWTADEIKEIRRDRSALPSSSAQVSSQNPASTGQPTQGNEPSRASNSVASANPSSNGQLVVGSMTETVEVERSPAGVTGPLSVLVQGLTPFFQIFLAFWLLMGRRVVIQSSDQIQHPNF